VPFSWEQIQALRMAGEPIFCDEACRNAGEQMREKVTAILPRHTEQRLCRHVAGTVGGRCVECGRVLA